MGEDHRRLRHAQGAGHGLVRDVREVDQHPQPIHLVHDLLAAQLVHDLADTHAPRADARADRIDVPVVRRDRELGAVPGFAGDRLDLDDAVDQFGNLELEEAADESGVGLWTVTNKAGERLLITVTELMHDSSHELGVDPGLVKDGVEAHLQELLAEQVEIVAVGMEGAGKSAMTWRANGCQSGCGITVPAAYFFPVKGLVMSTGK